MAITKLKQAIKETREFKEINGNPDCTDDEALDDLMSECGQDASGSCAMAGTEYCSFECLFS